MAKNVDAIIIGAGVIGSAIGFELAKSGFKTLNIDRNGEAGHGSTSGSCAVIRVHYSTREGTAFAYEGYHDWKHWQDYLETEDERGLAQFYETGCCVLKTHANGQMQNHIAHCAALNIPYAHWTTDDLRARFPDIDLHCFSPAKRADEQGFGEPTGGEIDGAIFFPTAGYVSDPALASHNLQKAAQAKGGKFLFNREITKILKSNGRASGVMLADGSEIHAPIVINVAGPASGQVNRLAGVTGDMTISTRALRQEVVHLPAPEGFFGSAGEIILSDSDTFCYMRPEKGGHLLIGSEDPPCDNHQWVDDVQDFDRNFTDQWQLQAMRFAQRVPTIGIPGRMKGVVDLYDVSDDWIPIYDRSSLPGYYMACGSSGNQFKNASIAGKLMAKLIDYCEAGNDHDVNPLQFAMPITGQVLDSGFFSRKRLINKESSFSVLG